MGDDYRRPIKPNRYWTRPKAKLYDCNMKEAERMYNDNYKAYQDAKDFRLGRDMSSYRTEPDRFAHLRAGPTRREHSVGQRFNVDSSASSVLESVLSRASVPSDVSSIHSDSKPPLPKTVPAFDPQKENQSLEERLERLKKLRDDLGLPQDASSSRNTLRDSATRTLGSDTESVSSLKLERSSRITGGAGGDESSYSYKSERQSKMNGIGDLDSSSSYKSDKSSTRLSARATAASEDSSEDFKTTPRSRRKFESTLEVSSSPVSERKSRVTTSSSSSAKSSGALLNRKVDLSDLGSNDVDDAFVEKMMKKLPSSQDILERISKMDLDD